jgi:phosphatidylglycerol---prolipoprotein diacylglyceryl transferase
MLPILYQNPDLIIYSYPLLMGLGWGAAYQIFMSGLPNTFSRSYSQIVFWGLFISSWIGAKVFFIITNSDGEVMVQNVNFWTGGGFVFYGGLIFGGLFLNIVRRLRPGDFTVIPNVLLPALAIGHAIGRLGCFLAGCCYGEVTDAVWGIHMHGEYRHPTQLLEAIGLTVLTFFLLQRRRSGRDLVPFYLVGYGCLRVFIELLRGDEVRGDWGGYSPSLTISFGLILLGTLLKFRKKSMA